MTGEPVVAWIDASASQPLCDVPWFGTVTVHASGDVGFCCHSSATVGNVKDETFREIWTGTAMQRIRAALAKGELPPECRSNSCPIVRGDNDWYVRRRMHGHHAGEADETLARIRDGLRRSKLELTARARRHEQVEAALHLEYEGPPTFAQLAIGVRAEDRRWRFLPDLEAFAIPCRSGISLTTPRKVTLPLFTHAAADVAAGRYEVCAALFAIDANLQLQANAYWAQSSELVITES